MGTRFLIFALSLLPLPALAHPHIFVQAKMAVIFDDVGGVAIRMDWLYDDYFSLLLTSDLGIDLDGDLVLTDDEVTTLAASVTDWPPDYNGDLEVMQGDAILPLGEKRDHSMLFEAGLVRETHLRPVAELADAAMPLTIRAYDPFYYVAYELVGDVMIEGRDDCTATVTAPDLDAAYTLVEKLLYGRPASDVGPDEEFPEVGAAFADAVTVTCAAPL